MSESKAQLAKLEIKGKRYEFPVLTGSEGEQSVDIRRLRKESGLTTFDPGFVNTASCQSTITYLDVEKGILRYRGYPVEELIKICNFIDVAYLLIHGELPNEKVRDDFARLPNRHSMIHESMRTFFDHFPENAHPMAILSAMVVSLSSFYPEMESDQEGVDMAATRLLSKIRTIAAFSYKKSIGEPVVQPSYKLSYCENFLNMMFASPVANYKLDPVIVRALDQLLILHADHEQNCSTSAVRLIGSSGANLYASVSAGICALWGPAHGGANQGVIQMLERLQNEGGDAKKIIDRAKDPNADFRLMGFGHRVYKTYDPRARIAKQLCEEVLEKLGINEPLLELAMKLEQAALSDDYFVERNLYPNVDFYTGIIFRAMGIPTDMFTVMFAIGRLPGWIANWLEWMSDPAQKIGRPRQLYVGPQKQKVPPRKQGGF